MSAEITASSAVAQPAADAPRVVYGLDDVPKPMSRAVLLGLQHVLTMFGATVSVPLILGPAMGFSPDEIAILVSSVMVASGVATLLQVNIGTRLPIIQGVSFAFLGPFFAIIAVHGRASMPHIAGAIILGAFVEMAIGYFGLVGRLRQLVSPVVIGPVIALIGLSLYQIGAPQAGQNWILSGIVIVLAFILALVVGPRRPTIQLFPILLAVLAAYGVALIGSAVGIFQPGNPGYVDFGPVARAPWFRTIGVGEGALFFPWGLPKFGLAAFLGILAGYVASIIESFGDYHSISLISTGKNPTPEQINAGIGAEGIGCFFTALVGGFASTSYTENIALVGLTRVASRYVVNIAAVFLIFLGLFAKFGAIIATLPPPVVGGMYVTLFGLIASVGLSALQTVNLNSQRNLLIIGFLLFFGLSLPVYFSQNPITWTGSFQWLGEVINTVGSTSMAVAAICGLILDNVIPGTREERGLID